MTAERAPRIDRGAVVRPSAFHREDALVDGLRRGDASARRSVYDVYGPHARAVLARLLGPGIDLADPLHDTFVEVFRSASSLREAASLKAWITSVAVHTARRAIRTRRRRRWLTFFAPSDLPEQAAPERCDDAAKALAATYRVLDDLPDDARMLFVLRYIEGLELTEVAQACGVSLATAKRRLAVANDAFHTRARQEPELSPWLEEGGRWTSR